MTILSRHHKFNSKMNSKFLKILSFSKVFTKFIFPQGITRLHNCVKFIIGGQFRPPCSYPTLNKLYFFWWNVPTFQPGNPSTFWKIFPEKLENKSKFLPVISPQSMFYWLCSTVIRRRHIITCYRICTPTQNFWNFFFYIQEFFDVFSLSVCVNCSLLFFTFLSLSLPLSLSLWLVSYY